MYTLVGTASSTCCGRDELSLSLHVYLNATLASSVLGTKCAFDAWKRSRAAALRDDDSRARTAAAG
eukprot:COSAG02_NODE_30712_length_546_cov_1.279642_2_plen_65_part_01